MIVDEIMCEADARALVSVIQQGVAVVATVGVHSLAQLLSAPGQEVRALIGDVDVTASSASKTLHRLHTPAVSAAVEVLDYNNYRVHTDVLRSVEEIIQGREVPVQTRWSPSPTGNPSYVQFATPDAAL